MRQRAKDNLPAVLLTLLSIVQALAIELMWEHLRQHDYLYTWSYVALISWLQICTSLLVVLLIWLVYTSLVMRFRWVPTTSDSTFPFLVGILEFTLIATLGPDMLGQWFLVLAMLFGAMSWVSQLILKRARLDAENDTFFAGHAPLTRQDLYLPFVTIAGLTAAGISLWLSADQKWLALIMLLGAAGLITYQLWLNDFYWRRSMGSAPP
jgi:hypothetical protein